MRYPEPVSICKKLSIFPVPSQHSILHLPENIVAECNNRTIAITNCRQTISTTFCRMLEHTTCASELVTGVAANCSTRFNDLDQVLEIDDGIVIINDAAVKIQESGDVEKLINGTYLVIFQDEVRINNTHYRNNKQIQRRSPGTPTFPDIKLSGHFNMLSLPLLHHSNVQNLQHIKRLEITNKIWSLSIFSIICGIFIVYLVIKRIKMIRIESRAYLEKD